MSDRSVVAGGHAPPFGTWERMLANRYLRNKRSQVPWVDCSRLGCRRDDSLVTDDITSGRSVVINSIFFK